MIELKNVSKSFNKNKKVIDNISLKVQDGEIFGFLGPNGVGKTTTIKMITGILEIDEGDILLDQKSIRKDPVEAKKQFGLVPDSPDMFLNLKGIEYLNFIGEIYEVPMEIRNERIIRLAKEFEIYNELNDKIESYSHGMRQKIVIIGVLLHNPKNWILDEPMMGLDPRASFILKEKMKQHAKKGNTVFFSTHVLEVAEKLCDRIAIIKDGKIILLGTYQEIREAFQENQSLEEIFMEITKNEVE
ncbi:MAG: ABC transporter ATP-binding protein [Clostridia bacterium]|nr:ABC transporter ATP-binding protein [Clostridia bacterium]